MSRSGERSDRELRVNDGIELDAKARSEMMNSVRQDEVLIRVITRVDAGYAPMLSFSRSKTLESRGIKPAT